MLYVFPQPNKFHFKENTSAFNLMDGYSLSDTDLTAQDLIRFIKKQFGISPDERAVNAISFSRLQTLAPESYTININDGKIEVFYSDSGGKLYAVQTLKQLLSQTATLPVAVIEDSPYIKNRWFMLDVGRYFYPVQQVKHFIDIMVLHKLNALHFHLTEDQGWRIEIKQYPLLTEKGSKRSHTNFNRIPHQGFYTQDEIKDIVSYANSRNIKVIPEFDLPGHMQAAISCYPELSCFDRKLPVATHWGVKHDIVCAGKESSYTFIYRVLDELFSLFPDGMIHIGGDEAVKTRWKICPHCQKAIKENGLRDENGLQAHMLNKINDYCIRNGYKTIMWSEQDFAEHYSPSIIQSIYLSAADMDALAEECRKGHKYVNSSSKSYYLDLPYKTIPLEATYNIPPMPKNETGDNCLGVEACLWTEYAPNMNKAYYRLFPRLTAFAERAWTSPNKCDYGRFNDMLKTAYDNIIKPVCPNAKRPSYTPNRFKAACEKLWFSRRVLHWAGLHNLIDNYKVNKKYGKRAENGDI